MVIFAWLGYGKYRRRSIVLRLMMVAVVVCVLAFAGQSVFIDKALREDVGAQSSMHQSEIADYVAGDIDERLRLRLDLLAQIAAGVPSETLQNPHLVQAGLAERRFAQLLMPEGLLLLTVDGTVLLAQPASIAALLPNPEQRDWFQQVVGQGRAVIGRPIRRGVTAPPLLTFAVPVRNPSGDIVAVLAGLARVDAEDLLATLQKIRIGERGSVMLVDPRDRLTLTASDTEDRLAPLPPPGVSSLLDRALAGFRGATEILDATGERDFAGLAEVPTAGWFVIARQPAVEALAVTHRLQASILRLSAIITLVVTMLVGLILMVIFRPLVRAARALHLMAKGDLAIAPLPVYQADEIGELATGFNFLLRKLEEKERALVESQQRMAHLAHHDMLTGLPNRVLFEDRLGQLIAQGNRLGSRFALLYLDLDQFKPINDSFGHSAGDAVLCQVALRISALLRKGDTVARIGGDEFAILLVNVMDPATDAPLVAEKCRQSVMAPVPYNDHLLTVGVSIGIACFPDDGTDAGSLLHHADQGMYGRKRARNARRPAPVEPAAER